MKKQKVITGQEKKVEELHWEIQKWKSHFQFLDDEIAFIAGLLNKYVFQPNTPNLFERLQDYQKRIKNVETTKKEIRNQISKHENTLGGMLECTDSACDLTYYRKHERLKTKVDTCITEFQELKSEIFNYAGGILKRRKP
jgi:chaperonin cofactor prefoldin